MYGSFLAGPPHEVDKGGKRGIEGDFSSLSLRGGRKADAAICAPPFFLSAFLFPD